ncbi:hypothetical protein [Marinicella litoralis]|uniref:Uncharacterized protein n=1 Tax=Marinicella litoralis TaxID=644220 RepID=A0A4R6XL82_9GAMM|nr:hypothetical protein [Marinicella litoralis]TDR16798.1 hypothetical protein C8D91_2704 [Marinicella litoralis]
MKKLIQLGLLSTAFSIWAANPEPVIYGTATETNGKQVTGTIRWGDQEAFLSDVYNGNKIATIGVEHLTDDEKEALEDHQPGPQARIGGLQVTFKSFFGKEIKRPYFNLPFGSIAKLTIDESKDLYQATLHDGTVIKSHNDTNDLSDEVYFLTPEGDTIEYDLDELSSIEFSKAPDDAKRFDQAIYGTITSDLGTLKGRVMWDKDERMVSEKLDGHENGQEYNLKFSEIRSIERKGNKSKVELLDGTVLMLGDTNDVDNGNRGIWLDNPNHGRIEIRWAQFQKLTIQEVDVEWMDFDDYQAIQSPLKGLITLKDESTVVAETMAFDLNQQSPFEMLDSDVDESNRHIPFKNIKKLTRVNDSGVELTLHDDTKIFAYGNRSVSRDNNGVMVKTSDQHQWIRWADIESIAFN